MKMKKSILVVLLLCCFAPASFADELQVTFFADFDNVIRNNLLRPTTVNGSFTWDTAAQTFSNVNITDNFNESMNTLVYSYFLEAGNSYGLPVGTMAGWTFAGPNASIQFSPGDHAFLGPQVIPEPGTYPTGMWFFDGLIPSRNYSITVAPIATPEPPSPSLVGLGLVALATIRRRSSKKLHAQGAVAAGSFPKLGHRIR